MKTLATIREQHPVMHYQKAEYELSGTTMRITFSYLIEPDLPFTHRLVFHDLPEGVTTIPAKLLQTAVNHLGLAELFNYWKLTASPVIHNHVVQLSDKQTQFWQIPGLPREMNV